MQLWDLCIDEFLLYQRDAFIYNLEKTEAGQEYLENAKRLEIVDTDYEAVERAIKGGGGIGRVRLKVSLLY